MIYHNKLDITKAVLEVLPDTEISLDQALFKWWWSGRSGSGLRLTTDGYAAFTAADLANQEFSIFDKNTSITQIEVDKVLLTINKKIRCPFYLDIVGKKITAIGVIKIYDERISMMITLYGSLKEYMDSVTLT
jgi:hypothetical protein